MPNRKSLSWRLLLLSAIAGFLCSNVQADPIVNQEGISGLFFDSDNPGHGFDFNMLDGGLIAYYYGHTSTGERLWLISELYSGNIAENSPIEMDMFQVSEGEFGDPTLPEDLWGTATIIFLDCDSGLAQLQGSDGTLQMQLVRLAGISGVQCNPSSGQALFSENFESYSYDLDWDGGDAWNVTGTGGTVDLIGDGTPDALAPPGNGLYVDLDGFGTPGTLETSQDFLLEAGKQYSLSFELAGNQGAVPSVPSSATDVVSVSLGPTTSAFEIQKDQPFITHQLTIVGDGDSYPITFLNSLDGDRQGALLDNVHLVETQLGTIDSGPPLVIETESNDEQNTANVFNLGDTIIGSLSDANDEDWYAIDINNQDTGMMHVDVDLSAAASGFWSVYWFAPDSGVLSGRNIQAPDGFQYQFPAFEPGRYHLRVRINEEIFYNGGIYKISLTKAN